jgi:hypothetical protein
MFGITPEALAVNSHPLLERILPEDRPGFEASVALSAQEMSTGAGNIASSPPTAR